MAVGCKLCLMTIAVILFVVSDDVSCSLHVNGLPTLTVVVFPLVAGPLALVAAAAEEEERRATSPFDADAAGDRLFTAEELLEYRGEKGLYLASLGLVYDVQKAEKHYGKGQKYHPLTGHDGTKAFVTGDFTKSGITDDLSEFTPTQMNGLKKWVELIPQDFPIVGKLIGRYYDENGQPTDTLIKVKKYVENAADYLQMEEDLKKTFPGCNSRFLVDEGGKFWCTTDSGGVTRKKPGFPRKFHLPETGSTRCACVQEDQLNDPRMSEYPDCAKDSTECKLKQAVKHTEL